MRSWLKCYLNVMTHYNVILLLQISTTNYGTYVHAHSYRRVAACEANNTDKFADYGARVQYT